MGCQDCRQGPCARCLAEDHSAGMTFSTLHFGSSVAQIPNYDDQALVAIFAREAVDVGLRRMGIQ